MGPDPRSALAELVGQSERLDLVGRMVSSRSSLIAGRFFTARLRDGVVLEAAEDLSPFVGSQRHSIPAPRV